MNIHTRAHICERATIFHKLTRNDYFVLQLVNKRSDMLSFVCLDDYPHILQLELHSQSVQYKIMFH